MKFILIIIISNGYVLGPKEFTTPQDCETALQITMQAIGFDNDVAGYCFDSMGLVRNYRGHGKAK